jgi:hypothetical protein
VPVFEISNKKGKFPLFEKTNKKETGIWSFPLPLRI